MLRLRKTDVWRTRGNDTKELRANNWQTRIDRLADNLNDDSVREVNSYQRSMISREFGFFAFLSHGGGEKRFFRAGNSLQIRHSRSKIVDRQLEEIVVHFHHLRRGIGLKETGDNSLMITPLSQLASGHTCSKLCHKQDKKTLADRYDHWVTDWTLLRNS